MDARNELSQDIGGELIESSLSRSSCHGKSRTSTSSTSLVDMVCPSLHVETRRSHPAIVKNSFLLG